MVGQSSPYSEINVDVILFVLPVFHEPGSSGLFLIKKRKDNVEL